ncbi:phosphoglycerate kinase [Candidatus Saccharibacteria bacterium]|nr:phosphoglycerate kinase [Candidatus Saccharibacteria bacterium]
MSFSKQTVRDIELSGKRVLLRVDYNLPMKNGKITSDFRIEQSLPTIKYLLDKHCSIVIMSHLGRPEGKKNKEFSLRSAAERLSKLLGQNVEFVEDCIGSEVEKAVSSLKPKQVLMLENVRFYPEEEANDLSFAEKLSKWGYVFVQDCFGVAHRAHASVVGVTKYLPSVAGLLLEKEVDTITKVMSDPERPLMAIVGGAKISDKIIVLKKFIEIADFVAIGGAMANTFLLAEGIETGNSLTEPDDVPLAKEIIALARARAEKSKFVFYLPQDGVVATDIENPSSTRIVDWNAQVIADIEAYPRQPKHEASHVKDDERILDIGPFSASFIAGGLQMVQTVVWNGTLGVAEVEGKNNDPIGPFAHGTELIVEALLGHYGHRPFTIVGGGDTAGYVEERNLTKAFNHVSTGGGASLELMEGKKLPGVEALPDKEPNNL